MALTVVLVVVAVAVPAELPELAIPLQSVPRKGQMAARDQALAQIMAVAAVVALPQLELPEVVAQQERAVMALHHLFPVAASPTQVAAVVALMAILAQTKALAARAVVARVARLHQITV